MKRNSGYRAIIFDMDNTLLRSTIDFAQIKRDTFARCVEAGVLAEHFPLHEHTIATLIEAVRLMPGCTSELEGALWDIVVDGERVGMAGAELEEHVPEVLAALSGKLHLTVLTNNAYQAALDALSRTGIVSRFELIAGRDQMTALKPSPSGVAYILSHYPAIAPEQWLCVGDSWIDGMAAREGGIDFLAYRARDEELQSRNVPAVGHIRSMQELLEYVY